MLNVLYCLLAAAENNLPGWHMFEDVQRVDYTLADRDGTAIDVRAYLPRGAHLVDDQELPDIVRFVCEKEPSRAPFTFENRRRGTRAVLDPSAGCQVRRAPR
ncbi:hypothetical protein AKJ09_07397 [Labilithrix luteola]|uniref:Uncharacterized protein n=1 Tax=Labilithrix luteola TaxID=1391654 RepID=A0A0K1Q4U9_9BACT|nr:hypothetical protein AKJ09_07397 [Labilithrix luteola]